MANYSATRSVHKTLAAGVADQVTISGYRDQIEVLNRSASDYIYFTTDGSAPAVAGDNTIAVPPGGAVMVAASNESGAEVVKLISAGAPAYSVTGS